MRGKKYVSNACLNCRRRKVKCDGNQECSNCLTSKLVCIYNANADMRRISAKKAITGLEARVAQLEGVLREENIEQPPHPFPTSPVNPATTNEFGVSPSGTESYSDMGETNDVSQTTIVAIAPVSNDTESIASASHDVPTLPLSSPTRQPSKGIEESDCPSENGMPLPYQSNNETAVDPFLLLHSMQPPTTQLEMSPVNQLCAVENLAEDCKITSLLSARMGSLRIAEDGGLRYYGPTSNLHVHQDGFQSLSRSTIRNVEREGLQALERLGLNHEIPVALEIHLAKLYFTWEDPAIHVVDEETFFHEKRQWTLQDKPSSYYSETLNNAICAVGASLAAGEPMNVPEPAADFFLSRAKALLDIEMDSPTVATVQALVVMSASEAAFTRDSRGWLYSGMAARLSADLGLHLDMTRHRSSGLLSQRDQEIRQMTFWGVFTHEHMWSLYVGRPWGMGIENVTVPQPNSRLDEIERRIWKPYPSVGSHAAVSENGVPFPLHTCTAAIITLCEFMRRINTTLYSDTMIGIEALVQFLAGTKQELWNWHENLGTSMCIDDSSSSNVHAPAVLQLHMQFHATIILLHRPYLSNQLKQRADMLGSLAYRAALHDVAVDCVSAAHQISEILRCYQRQHSLRRTNIQIVHIILTAALIFLHDICTREYTESRVSLRDLQFCCHALGEIGQCYGNATRALEVIILVKSEWQRLAMTAQTRTSKLKRPSVSTGLHYDSDGDDRPRRRNRTSSFATDSFDSPGNMMPPPLLSTSDAYQILLNSNGETPNMALPKIADEFHDIWTFSDKSHFSLQDMALPMDWFDQSLEDNPTVAADITDQDNLSKQNRTNDNRCRMAQSHSCRIVKAGVSRRRAARACLSCRKRKVRASHGSDSRFNGQASSVDASNSKVLDAVNALNDGDPVYDLAFLNHCDVGENVPRHSNERESSPGVGSGLQEKARSCQHTSPTSSSHWDELDAEDIYSDPRHLHLNECFRIPAQPMLHEFFRHYFLYVHPMLPILNEGDFWDRVSLAETLGSDDQTPPVPPVLLQAMLFASCSFLSEDIIGLLGYNSIRSAKAALYKKSKLLYHSAIQYDHVVMAQSCLLLTYWCPSLGFGGMTANSKWLSLAIHHAKMAKAEDYSKSTCGNGSTMIKQRKKQNVLKRLWWCCVIRDRIMPLCVRRSIQIGRGDFDFIHNTPLCDEDLSIEVENSRVYDANAKRSLISIMASMVELCITLTDVLDLVYPANDPSVSDAQPSSKRLMQIHEYKRVLEDWATRSTMSSPTVFADQCNQQHDSSSDSDSTVLFANLLQIYYHSAHVALCNYELRFAVISTFLTPRGNASAELGTIDNVRMELWSASIAITKCLDQLLQLRLARWLPSSAVGCTALPLALHLLDIKLLPPSPAYATDQRAQKQDRLNILIQAMKEYHPKYDGVDWISKTIRYFMDIPKGDQTCSVSIIDTTCNLTVPADTLVEPVIPGHELMNFPTVAFLITHQKSGTQLLFDLGCRKDFWNLPQPIAETIDLRVPGIKVEKSLVEILLEGEVDVSNIKAAIISHHHYDHMGDPTTFPSTMALIVGPGFSENFLPGYPAKKESPAFEAAFSGRTVREVSFSAGLVVAGYLAVDYFADGSLYILETPGHAIGHLSALVRTTPDTFVFLGGDICHFGGAFRPTQYVPMPSMLSSSDLACQNRHAAFVACSRFTVCHPDPENSRTSPFYKPCSRSDSWYIDPSLANKSIGLLAELDANDKVLVLIAHDPSVMGAITFFPDGPLNGWHEAGWKQKLRWGFLDELPVKGKPAKCLVDGTYMGGSLVKTLDGHRC
ncbi:fungal-specific transcription factor domain-containing protein [Dactylonectria estremocensis]|uniref:Fungal-specific transcription factor domain-containing protein n=1 Tax=Dactylonectria estremocensis TaxID=1079267 RepID=A0A9P9E608_9HYPO|nr:fungal-specific transcription factor domain-containing protein [Dactylonectria estremocensis]